MTAQHTPGPWRLSKTRNQGRYLSGENWGEFAHVVTVISFGKGELQQEPIGEANARLIAAAPDLLAAAEIVLAGLEARIDEAVKAGGRSVPVFNGIADLHDAIAKARGEG